MNSLQIMNGGESSVATCPYCQMPLFLLRIKSPGVHLEACFRKRKPKQECSKGVQCRSEMICHYERFAHTALARIRSKPAMSCQNIILDDDEDDDNLAAAIQPPSIGFNWYKDNIKCEPEQHVLSYRKIETIDEDTVDSGIGRSCDRNDMNVADRPSSTSSNANVNVVAQIIKSEPLEFVVEEVKEKAVKEKANVHNNTPSIGTHIPQNDNAGNNLCNQEVVVSSNDCPTDQNYNGIIGKTMSNTYHTEPADELPLGKAGHVIGSTQGAENVCPRTAEDCSVNSNLKDKEDFNVSITDQFVEKSFNVDTTFVPLSSISLLSSTQAFPLCAQADNSVSTHGDNMCENVDFNIREKVDALSNQTTNEKHTNDKILCSEQTESITIGNNSNSLQGKRPLADSSTNCQSTNNLATAISASKPTSKKFGKFSSNVKASNSQPYSTRGRKCPFYKKVEGTEIAVDAFSYGLVDGVKLYFLSHFHYDHYQGLTKSWKANVYCSVVTGDLVQMKIKVPESQIIRLPLNTPVNDGNVEVTLLEANHCPGAVLFLFKLKNGKCILHTGDFRADDDLMRNSFLVENKISILYLDTTYLNPTYTFPAQEEVVAFATKTVVKCLKSHPDTLIVTGTYTIGKEKIFLDIAKKLGCKACVSKEKLRIIQCFKDKRIDALVTTDKESTYLHVLTMAQLKIPSLKAMLSKYSGLYSKILAIKPTGWAFAKRKGDLSEMKVSFESPIVICELPYSEHSSFTELKRFVEVTKPDKIVPTVNVGNAESRKQMALYLDQWMKVA